MNEGDEMVLKRSKTSDARQDLLLSDTTRDLLRQYGCGPIQFSGTNDALYERHLLFDDIVAPTAAGVREQIEAAARSARTSFRNVGCGHKALTITRTRNGSTTCQWNF
jgi:hypothetical protein